MKKYRNVILCVVTFLVVVAVVLAVASPQKMFANRQEMTVFSVVSVEETTREETDITDSCDTETLKELLPLMETSRIPTFIGQSPSNLMEYELHVGYTTTSVFGENWHDVYICIDKSGESYLYENAGRGYYRIKESDSWYTLIQYIMN
jgi:hypothetical protein